MPSEDDHHVEIHGRRWRATDPTIPERFRKELVAELMAARRAVKEAKASTDASAERAARDRVHDAKVALGERGRPWWETDARADPERTAAVARALLRHRAPTSSICPSDVARVVGADGWRELLDGVRSVAAELAGEGQVRLTAGADELDPAAPIRGPIRVRRGDGFPDPPA